MKINKKIVSVFHGVVWNLMIKNIKIFKEYFFEFLILSMFHKLLNYCQIIRIKLLH